MRAFLLPFFAGCFLSSPAVSCDLAGELMTWNARGGTTYEMYFSDSMKTVNISVRGRDDQLLQLEAADDRYVGTYFWKNTATDMTFCIPGQRAELMLFENDETSAWVRLRKSSD